MDAKLTLKLDKSHIETAKKYAARRRTSLSSLVERYFAFLSDQEATEGGMISPAVKRLSGVLKLGADFDLKREKAERLSEKYK